MAKKRGGGNAIANGEQLLWDAEEQVDRRADTRGLVTLWTPQDVLDTLRRVQSPVTVVLLDPWYNKGIGGVRPDYDDWLAEVVAAASRLADHVYVWGFPEIVWRLLNRLPDSLSLI